MPRLAGTQIGVRPDGSPHYVPLIRVQLESGTMSAEVGGILDSGADHTIVPAAFAEAVGVRFWSLPRGTQGQGASGTFEMRRSSLRVHFDGRLICGGCLVAAPDTLPVLLLGRDDFFRMYQVRFSWHRDPPTFDLDPVVKK